ncbi:helix-turn-helix domain-containing protein [Paenibacillus thalictri]|uniref:Helix-turn-helix domain-containing protein n=1 Tax=Paenibacillus thalictri TaxID=2527873 RepID=A0A4Q9DKN6_9BACL|nr:helix-turn-helix domain-containing protein [Paenibacillus thalictri]TBL72722.1 helix-turn-helix domain-containing protein [Paenibacillus thalictri]
MDIRSILNAAWSKSKPKGNYYRKSLIFVLIITSLPTAVIAISTYFIGMQQMEKEVYHKNQYQLEQVFSRLEEQFSQLEMTIDKGTFNPSLDEKLRDANFVDEYMAMLEVYQVLGVLQSSSPMIARIDLYLKNQQLLVSNDRGLISLEEEPNSAAYDTLLNGPDMISWGNTEQYYTKEKALFPLVLIHKVPIISTRPFGALLVYLNKSMIAKQMTQLNPYENGISFISKANGEWIASSKDESAHKQALKEMIRDKMVKMESASDSFVVKWEGQEYSVAYATFSRTGWRYMIATPLSQLMAPISLTSKLMLGVSAMGLVIAAFLSWFASRRMYRPIHRLVQMFSDASGSKPAEEDRSDEIQYIENKWLNVTRESRLIQSLLDENRSSMKQAFLLQLIQGHLYFFSEAELRDQMNEHGWDTEDKTFALLLIQLSPFAETKRRFVEGDEQLVTFAAANIIEELAADNGNMKVINLHNLTVSLFVSFERDKDKEQIRSEIYAFSGEIIKMIAKLMGVHVSIGISKQVDQIRQLPKAFDEVKQCLHFRSIGEQGQILNVEDFIPEFKEILDYPFRQEKELIQAIQMGTEEQAIQQWTLFLQALKMNTDKAFLMKQYIAQLLGSVIREMMQLGVNPSSVNPGINLYDQLFGLLETDGINKWFIGKVIRPFIKTLTEKQGIEMKKIIRNVKEIIEQEYMNDISLEIISDRIGMLPKRLSAVFVQVTGQNFIDYVTEIRLEKSKELLRGTDWKVNDIAAKVGYQASYFNKVFKKTEGMTPGEYRESAGSGMH